MGRFLPLTCLLVCVLSGAQAAADEPPKKLTPAQIKDLEAKRLELMGAGIKLYQSGKYAEATKTFEDALEMARRLYTRAAFPNGHGNLATTLNNVAFLYQIQGRYTDAEPLYREALATNQLFFKGDHPVVALSLNSLGRVCMAQGKYAEAERWFTAGLDMHKRLFSDDHSDLALSMDSLANVFTILGKYGEAEALFRRSLEMNRRIFNGDHLFLARSINNLGSCLQAQRKFTDAEPLFHEAHEMVRRLVKGDDLNLALSLRNLGSVTQAQGKYTEAEQYFRDSLDTTKRLFSGDNPHTAAGLYHLASLLHQRGRNQDTEPLYLEAVRMDRRLVQAFAAGKSEGEALSFIATLPRSRDDYLSNARELKTAPDQVYAEIWSSKGSLTRVYEQRNLAARAAALNPTTTDKLTQLTDARHRRADLLLAPEAKDMAAREKREEALKEVETSISDLERVIRPLLPSLARTEKLNGATVRDLQKVLPADAAVVDFLLHVRVEYDKDKPGLAGMVRTARYQAFVVTRSSTVWVDLDAAEEVDKAVTAWRTAITGGQDIPNTVPARVRTLVWDKVRKEIPASVKTVYLSPDAGLCRIPWGALPGDKPGTVLLEDYAIATIPHAPFLLDKLTPVEPTPIPRSAVLVVGGVQYDVELPASKTALVRGEPLMYSDQKLRWGFLPGTVGELNGVSAAAERKNLSVIRIEGDRASSAVVLASMRKARTAHIATHGFFADHSFRSSFHIDPKDFEQSAQGERIGKAAQNPLVMTGLVFAGANLPATPGRGIVTGESIVDLDLSGLELAVLSACETGLGDVAGGEGSFGLQRAFHLAGTRDVIASLWKVPDQSTAALMALFYRNLWEKGLTPLESLRQAQLEIYRNPGKIGDLAKDFRGKFEVVSGAAGEVKPGKDGAAHPLLWAAFALSGPGR